MACISWYRDPIQSNIGMEKNRTNFISVTFNTMIDTLTNVHNCEGDICKLIFLLESCFYFYSNFMDICSKLSNYQCASIGSNNDLALNWRHSIALTNGSLVYHWSLITSVFIVNCNFLKHILIVNILPPFGASVTFSI